MKLFDKCVALIVKCRHFLIVGALLCGLLIISGWAYVDNIREATDNTTYAWVVDNAQSVTEPIAVGSSFRQSFTTSEPVFGAGFFFTTYNEVCYGTLIYLLEDENGTVVASGAMLGIDLYDNIFQQLPFPDGIYPDGETTYTFVVQFFPDADKDSTLGVWVSDVAIEGIDNYELNGETADTCASFALVTNYAGDFIVPIFFACVAFAAFTLVAGYWLLFIRKAKLHHLFIFFSLTLGLLYMALIPAYVAPDEETHIHTAYALSNTMLGIENEGIVSLRASDDITLDKADTMDIFSYQTIAQNLFGQCEDTTMVATDYTIVYTEPFYLYLPTAIGMTIGRLFNFNYITLIYFARVMNLLTYTALVAIGIYHLPRFKRVLCVVALLPMPLMLASSVNYDAIVIATAFLYTAIVLKTVQCEADFSWKQILTVGILALLLAPMKKLYIFLCLLCFIFPLRKCPKLIRKTFWYVIGAGFLVFIFLIPTILERLYITEYFLHMASVSDVPEFNPLNIDYTAQYLWLPPYILTHLNDALKLILRTIQENTGLYLVQLIGGKAGEYILLDLPIWTPLIFVFYAALFISTVPTPEEDAPLLSLPQKCWSSLLVLATIAGLTIVCLTWSSWFDTTIWGLQGRYLLPILPLTLFIFQSKVMIVRQNIERHLLLILFCSNIIAIVSVFQQIMDFAYNT